MRFTSEQAFDASDAGEPIMISRTDAVRICGDHDCGFEEFEVDTGVAEMYDAGVLLAWLGY